MASQRQELLVIDDTPDNLHVLFHVLSDQGYTVRCARSGSLAIKSSQVTPPDLILLDILMPQMDGYEVCRRLKQDSRTGDVPVIFLSVLDGGQDKAKAFAAGGDDYIAKPFNTDEVLARVKHQLDLRQRKIELQRQAEAYEQASHKLRDAYTFVLEVLDGLTEGVAALQPIRNEAGNITDFKPAIANKAFLKFLSQDLDLSELNEKTWPTLLEANPNSELFALCLLVANSNESIQRELLRLQGNHQQWIEAFATRLQNNVITSLHDISNLKEQIAALTTLKQELYKLATTDGLTQVGNRYQFDAYFTTEWQRALREQQPLALLIADIDQFKRFNDICGHIVGDRCLCEVARVIQESVKRPADLLARYGGEEFAIVLPNTPLQGALQMAQDIQQGIRNLHLLNVPSNTCEQVCISIGISCAVPQVHQRPSDLIGAADQALYRAKALGGNTNCIEMM